MTPQIVSPNDSPTLTAPGHLPNRAARLGLADGFIELFAFVQDFRRSAGSRQPSYDTVRGDILRLLKQSEAFPAKGGCSWDEYDAARFAVCAWVDERVMAAGWDQSARWRAEPLQRLYYGTTEAGEKFFDRLRQMGAAQNAVREVYFLCLALGFEGRYGGPDSVMTLHELKTQNLRLLFDGAAETPTVAFLERERLFPDAVGLEPLKLPPKPSARRSFFVTHVIVWGSALVLIALYVIFRWSLYSLGSNILRAVGTR